MIWFTSDQHYCHSFMIKGIPGQNIPRPMFSSVEEMNETMIDNHNKRVKPGDLVYNLGDWCVRGTVEQAMGIRKRLNGNHYLIRGNHEEVGEKMFKHGAFIWLKERHTLSLEDKQRIVLDHYAMKVWHGSYKGVWQLYGHSHSMLPEDHTLSFDVGVDAWNFAPVSLEQVREKMNSKLENWQAYKDSLKGLGRVE